MIAFKRILLALVILILIGIAYVIFLSISYYSEKRELPLAIAMDKVTYLLEIDDPLSTFSRINSSPIWETYYDHREMQSIKQEMDAINELLTANSSFAFLMPFISGEVTAIGYTKDGQNREVYAAHIGLKLYLLQESGLFGAITTLLGDDVSSERIDGLGRIYYLDLPAPTGDVVFLSNDNLMFLAKQKEDLTDLLMDESKVLPEAYLRTWDKVTSASLLKGFWQSQSEESRPDAAMLNIRDVMAGFSFSLQTDAMQIQINGLASPNDSALARHPLAAILEREPEVPDNFRFIPAGSAGFLHFNLGSFSELYQRSELMLADDADLYKRFKENELFVKEELGIDLRKDFAAWIGHEITLLTLSPRTYRSFAEKALIIETRNKVLAREAMERVQNSLEEAYPIRFRMENYRGYYIHQLELPFFLRLFLGQLFEEMPKPFYTFIDDAFVAADEVETLQFIIDSFLAGTDIRTDASFTSVAGGESEGNIFLYANLAKGIEIADELIAADLLSDWALWRPYLEAGEALFLRLDRRPDRLFAIDLNLQLLERQRSLMVNIWSKDLGGQAYAPPLLIPRADEEHPDIVIFTDRGTITRYDHLGRPLRGGVNSFGRNFRSQPLRSESGEKQWIIFSTGRQIIVSDPDFSLDYVTLRTNDIVSSQPYVDTARETFYFGDWGGTFYQADLNNGTIIDTLRLAAMFTTSPHPLAAAPLQLWQSSANGSIFSIRDSAGLHLHDRYDISEGISAGFTTVTWDNQPNHILLTWAGLVHSYVSLGEERLTYPVKLPGLLKSRAAAITRDDNAAIAVATENKLIYLLDEDSNTLPGWPVRVYGSLVHEPVIYDLDNDGKEEVIVLAGDGRLYAFDQQGKILPQWPLIANVNPAFYETDDGRFMVTADWNGKVNLWQLGE
jgi:hypothetical protein